MRRYMVGYKNAPGSARFRIWGQQECDGIPSMTKKEAQEHLRCFTDGQVYKLVPVDLEVKK